MLAGMARTATAITLTDDQERTLRGWTRSGSTQQRYVRRARIVLAAARGRTTEAIADELGVRPNTVSRWRMRFAAQGLAGLRDAPRSGKPATYDETTERRVLDQLDRPPPKGHATWTGGLLAEALGDVSDDQVWRVLRKQRICLRRRRSWCISTDPDFAAKAADIVGLYLHPPQNALVLCVDEKTGIQALERRQGYLRLPDGRALAGFGHEYKRHGTTTLFAALNVATGQVKAGHYQRRRRREFLHFMNDLLSDYPNQEIHVVLDNLNTHKPKYDAWLARHRNVQFHFTPTRASWLNQVEIWFSILTRRALRGASFSGPGQVRQAIDDFVKAYNPRATPFEWRKAKVVPGRLRENISELCK